MFRLEERRQQRVGAQQALARQLMRSPSSSSISVLRILPATRAPLVKDVDAELLPEVTRVELALFSCRIISRISAWCGVGRAPAQRQPFLLPAAARCSALHSGMF